ncbi:sensor histidine kinase [Paenibacillus piri]|uniref:histidine kinase n=1 Tax=Paenibacillus piri TaxID=2547395 RepID=A0A4R5KCJ2_9BACL|nr:sensor histidine kinase [Paenibacillus piri]TDF93039.1 hypothetical protein E1757_28690 [Paenibacillus piri]
MAAWLRRCGIVLIWLTIAGMLAASPTVTAAQTQAGGGMKLSLVDEISTYSLNRQMDILEDPQGKWSIEDVQSPAMQDQFRPAKGKSSFGYTSSAYWVRAVIVNDSSNSRWEISVLNPLMDRIAIYPAAEMISVHRHYPTYQVLLQPGEQTTIYMRFETYGSMMLPLQLIAQSALYDSMHNQLLYSGIYNGVLLVIMVFQMVLFLYTRNRAYLYYALYVISFCIAVLIWNGFTLRWFGLEPVEGSGMAAAGFWSSPSGLYDMFYVLGRWFGCLFAVNLLMPRDYSRLSDWICRALNVFCPLLCISMPFLYPYGMASFLFWFKYVSLFLMMLVLILCAVKGSRIAFFLAIPKVPVVLIAIVPKALLMYGLLPNNFLTRNIAQFGVIGDFVFMAVLLYALMNQMRRKEETTLQALVVTLSSWNASLNKRVEEQTESLKQANVKLIESEAFRTRMLQNISHDVRNPLSYVQSGVQALHAKLEMRPEEQDRLLRKLRDKVQDVNRFIDDLLDLTRWDETTEDREARLVIFNEWMEEMGEALAADIEYAGRRCVLSLEPAGTDVDVRMNPHAIKRVLANLIHNACKYTPPGGTITIHVSYPADAVRVVVEDTGPGISPELLERIFQRHYSGVGSESSGLGLAIAKDLVERHGGAIGAESGVGQGSRFYFTLPVVRTDDR